MLYSKVTYQRRKKLWEKPRNIIRALFIITWIVMVFLVSVRYQGYERRAIIVEWTCGTIGLYIGTVSIYLADKRNRMSYRNLFETVFCRCIGIVGFILFTFYALITLRNTFCDVFIDKPITVNVSVAERHREYKTYDSVVFNGADTSFKAVPSYVRLEAGGTYKVKIFQNSRIAIGIEQK